MKRDREHLDEHMSFVIEDFDYLISKRSCSFPCHEFRVVPRTTHWEYWDAREVVEVQSTGTGVLLPEEAPFQIVFEDYLVVRTRIVLFSSYNGS